MLVAMYHVLYHHGLKACAMDEHDELRESDCILGDRQKISGTYREFIVCGPEVAVEKPRRP